MFYRREQMLELAELATGTGLMDFQRTLWRELVKDLLGADQRRQHLRADFELEVDILSPEELVGVATSNIGPGGLALVINEPIPVGTDVELSIKVEQRPVPLLARAKVVYSKPPKIGVMFTNLIQSDRELLEGIAVKAILSESPSGASGGGS
jgi:hypothetical protein